MALVNGNFAKLKESYLFADIAARVRAFSEAHPEKKIIKMGIGDVTLPLAPSVIAAMAKAVEEMGHKETFRGYGPEQGYGFLQEAIQKYYARHGVELDIKEIFVSDGAKSDCGNIGDIFDVDNVVAVCDPVYPVYVDTNAMAGRAGDFVPELGRWSRLVYMPCVESNGFMPEPPKEKVDIIYLCFPNNPTGSMATREQLKMWVDYANKNGSIILYASAYEAFISDPDIPHTIFEIEGARTCAIEFRSFSKTAGFTGTRCGFMVIPHGVKGMGGQGQPVELNAMWKRRMGSKFNGVSYPIQRAAEAVYSRDGWAQCMDSIRYYLRNAQVIREGLEKAGYTVFGGVDAPYIWMKTPDGMASWDFFDLLLRRYHVVGTPGAGFGPCGPLRRRRWTFCQPCPPPC